MNLNNNSNVTFVILGGGFGSRLWPLSRTNFPKQFLNLSGELSLFQDTLTRLKILNLFKQSNETIVVTNEEHRFLALDQLEAINFDKVTLLLEPESRNTAPALTLAAFKALDNDTDPILFITPADHIIKDQKAFEDAVSLAIEMASNDVMVILGIKPNRPETGFGYIKQKGTEGQYKEFNVAEFKEKPNLEEAQKYIESNEYVWNSGMFVMKASVWLKALKKCRPDIFFATKKAFDKRTQDNKFIRPDSNFFKDIPSDSIDYAVMEKSTSVYPLKVIALDAGWNDLGSWESLWEVSLKNNDGNLIRGDVLAFNTKDSLIFSSNRLIVTSGLKDLVVIETDDSILVIKKNQSQSVKTLVDQLAIKKRQEYKSHRKIVRPWGWFDTLDHGERFKVKRIQVKPGASLSLQSHSSRAEHWVVVKGVANIICGEKKIILKENESTYIPVGIKHQLSNFGEDILEIIEVQSGSYLSEDDIERFEDNYGRAKIK